jgi:hypothetical protein
MNRFDDSADLPVTPTIYLAPPALQLAAPPLGSAAPGNKNAQHTYVGQSFRMIKTIPSVPGLFRPATKYTTKIEVWGYWR